MAESPIYTACQLKSSTHLIVHNDKFYEYPYIYVKVYPAICLAVVIDTGCGADCGQGTTQPSEIKTFIETTILPKTGVNWQFMVICTHCHFDHIGGIEPFATVGATICASRYDENFSSPDTRGANSLCEAVGMTTPEYCITHHIPDQETVQFGGHDLRLTVLWTPGHTPDSLAVFDEEERWLYVGDTCYKRSAKMPWGETQDVPIVFPRQGDWQDYMASLAKLRAFTRVKETDFDRPAVRIACGHTTSDAPAADFLERVHTFAQRV